MTVLKEINPEDELLGEKAYYFEMDLKNYDTKLVIGIPKNKNDTKWSMNVYTWTKLHGLLSASIK